MVANYYVECAKLCQGAKLHWDIDITLSETGAASAQPPSCSTTESLAFGGRLAS